MSRLAPSALLLLASLISAPAANNNTAPAPTAPIPATVDVVTFSIHTDGEDRKLIVIPTPSLLRVDVPRDGLTILYDSKTEHYTGLENRNYTYWEFSWPAVRAAVEASKRYESRLRDFGADSIDTPPPVDTTTPPVDSTVPPPAPDTNTSTSASPPESDDSGYVWQTTTQRKRIAGLDCVLWTGTSLASDPVKAWCYAGLQPAVQNAFNQLHDINEPIALVPVRDLVPPFVFEVTRALAKGGVTPLLITWGDAQDKNTLELTDLRTRDGKLSLFSVPKLYVKTTLVTMDGIGDQKVQEAVPPADYGRHHSH